MSKDATMLATVAGGTLIGYYVLQDKNAGSALLYLAGGGAIGGVAYPSFKAKAIVFNQDSALIGLVAGGAAYYLVGAVNGPTKESERVRKRVCSHCD